MRLINGEVGFVNGNPSVGTAGTVVTAEWLNSLENELQRVIEASGGVINPSNNEQLYNAIVTIAQWFSEVPASVTDAGVVELATSAETAAGLDLERAVTPAGNMAMFTNGRTNNIQPFPGGYKIQVFEVGHVGLGNNATIAFTFPAAFTTFCFPILSSASTLSGESDSVSNSTEGAEITSYTLSGGVITSYWQGRGAGVFRIVAFGR